MVHSICRRDSSGRKTGYGLVLLLIAAMVASCLPSAVASELDPGADAREDTVQGLGQAALQKAFAILKQRHIRAEQINAEVINRVALEGLLRRLRASVELAENEESSADKSDVGCGVPTMLERLDGDVAYLRLSLADRIPEADELAELVDGVAWLLVDLRTADGCDDFSRAARFLGLFAPAGNELFRLRGTDPSRDEIFRSEDSPGPLRECSSVVVLVDADTSPAGEVIAGWFALRQGSLVAGEPTADAASRFARVPIAEGVWLRFAEAEVVFPGGHTLLGRGVDPVLPMRSSDSKEVAFARSLRDGVRAGIVQRQRPRMNEAALVTGIDPQLAAHVSGDLQVTDEPVEDVALRQLVDLLSAIDHLGLAAGGMGSE